MTRCRKHFQGDKCRLASGHENAHISTFHSWKDDDKIDELFPPSISLAKRDHRRLLTMEPLIRKKAWPVYLQALKNCEQYTREALDARRNRPFQIPA